MKRGLALPAVESPETTVCITAIQDACQWNPNYAANLLKKACELLVGPLEGGVKTVTLPLLSPVGAVIGHITWREDEDATKHLYVELAGWSRALGAAITPKASCATATAYKTRTKRFTPYELCAFMLTEQLLQWRQPACKNLLRFVVQQETGRPTTKLAMDAREWARDCWRKLSEGTAPPAPAIRPAADFVFLKKRPAVVPLMEGLSEGCRLYVRAWITEQGLDVDAISALAAFFEGWSACPRLDTGPGAAVRLLDDVLSRCRILNDGVVFDLLDTLKSRKT